MEIITDFAGGNAILARNFLRHRVGRHFADAVMPRNPPHSDRAANAPISSCHEIFRIWTQSQAGARTQRAQRTDRF
jgi:hypothetical protein